MTSVHALDHAKHLPLHEEHVRLGARLGDFAEWKVPLYYSSILSEHQAVRTRAGLFDISHMGEVWVEGSDAKPFLQYLVPNDMNRLCDGKALYTQLLNHAGGILDDIVVYQVTHDQFMLIVNATMIAKDTAWIEKQSEGYAVHVTNRSATRGIIALQGPESGRIVHAALQCDPTEWSYYHFRLIRAFGHDIVLSQTGYTGEYGFEFFFDLTVAEPLWKALYAAGERHGLQAVGFGARDTLRLEACYLLYGHDMNESTTPWEAGLGWTVRMNAGDFIGRRALLTQQTAGLKQRLASFTMQDRAVPREGYALLKEGETIGTVTSGGFSPTLQQGIGLGYVASAHAAPGTICQVQVRTETHPAQIVAGAFYKRK